MKHFTRERFEALQPPPRPEDGRQAWAEAARSNEARLNAIRERLPASVLELAELDLHDAVVLDADRATPGEVFLRLDCSDCPWGATGIVELRFSGVRSFSAPGPLEERQVLCEELDLVEGDAFEYSVLLDRGEFSLVAEALDLRQIEPKPGEVGYQRWATVTEIHACAGAKRPEFQQVVRVECSGVAPEWVLTWHEETPDLPLLGFKWLIGGIDAPRIRWCPFCGVRL